MEWPAFDVQLNLAPLQSLNGKSLAELAALRKDSLTRDGEPQKLQSKSYEFEQRPVWRQVGGGESWNGVEGMPFGKAANQVQTFSSGLFTDSYVLLNPYLPASIYPHFGSFGVQPDKEY